MKEHKENPCKNGRWVFVPNIQAISISLSSWTEVWKSLTSDWMSFRTKHSLGCCLSFEESSVSQNTAYWFLIAEYSICSLRAQSTGLSQEPLQDHLKINALIAMVTYYRKLNLVPGEKATLSQSPRRQDTRSSPL